MKSIKLIYKTISLLFACGLFTTCDSPIEEIKIDQESKDYCLFDEGSYWIYQDSASLETDSIFIDHRIGYRFSRSSGNGCKCENYNTIISAYSQDTMLFFVAKLTTSYANPDLLKPCLLFVSGVKYHNGEINDSYGDNATLKLISIKNLSTYSNVKIFEYKYLEEKEIYYWAKHIGLIRMEIYEDDSIVAVRNLIKYNVRPYKQ